MACEGDHDATCATCSACGAGQYVASVCTPTHDTVCAYITAPCPATEPWAAIVIGMIGGVVYFFGVKLLEALRIDDVVLAIPVHCFW